MPDEHFRTDHGVLPSGADEARHDEWLRAEAALLDATAAVEAARHNFIAAVRATGLACRDEDKAHAALKAATKALDRAKAAMKEAAP